MSDSPISRLSADFASSKADLLAFFARSRWSRMQGTPGVSDFVVGNPHEAPIPEIEQVLKKWSAPRRNDWFAYKMNEPAAQEIVAQSLESETGIPFQPGDVDMTPGAFGAMPVVFRAVMDPGDELVFCNPGWFFYAELAQPYGVKSVPVQLQPPKFELDPEVIRAVITPKTRVVIINSPNNPSGRIYQPDQLADLGDVLRKASEFNQRPIYLLSDESYRDVRFDDNVFHSPAAHYDRTFVMYTYGKTLLAPGQRIGYLAVSPTMPDKQIVTTALFGAQLNGGWSFPNALMQHALGDLAKLSIDLKHFQSKRDRMVEALRDAGYELESPEGTFYLLVKCPFDESKFVSALAERDVFVLSGMFSDAPSYFRISLTATDEMIDRALPIFAEVIEGGA